MKQTRFLAVLCALCAVLLPLAGCKKAAVSGVLIYARGNDSKKLDPADVTDGESVKVCTNIFETLVTYAEGSADVVPLLATSWEHDEKGTSWTFQLREGVSFHDGTPFDADAVVFCFERLMDPKNPHRFGGAFSYASNYDNIQKVESQGKRTVRFGLKAPSAVFLVNMAMFPACIQSPAAIKKDGENYFKNPVGTGPYRFVSWLPKEKIVLEAFDGYWGEKARTKTLIFKPVPDNSTRRVQLEQGEVHIIDGINFSDVEGLKKNAGVEVDLKPGMNFGYLAMNTLRPPFDKKEVRQAIHLAIEKEKIRALAFHGFGELGPNPMPPTIFGYHQGIADRPYDPKKAREMLQAAGVKEGLKVNLFAMSNPRPYMPQPRKVAQVIKENLKAVGIEAKIVSPEWQTYLEQTMNAEHDLCLLGWTTDNGDPDNFLWQLLGSENAVIGSAMNVSFYKNPEVDALFREGKTTMNRDYRKQVYEKAQEAIFEDVPMIPLAYFPQVVAYRKGVAGYRLHPTGIVRLWTVTLGDK
jgi:peptide/nickel transport system substrate-binding protein